MISLRLNDKTERLRADFLAWLKSNPPPEVPGRIDLDHFVDISRKWQRQLAAEHWIAVHWPQAQGGRGLTLADEAVIQECLAAHRSPQLVNLFGLTMVGPVLIEYGTEEQRQRFLPKILSADEIWCQGFSEPGAGSDLAGIRTKAVKTEGGWELTGQKIWTSFAHHASWCFILARNSAEENAEKTGKALEGGKKQRHEGLSYFLLSMKEKGITVRPLAQITGEKEFNELFLEAAPIDKGNIVGKEGQGWDIAISTLMYERVILTFARHLQSEEIIKNIREQLEMIEATESQWEKFGQLIARSMAVRTLALSHLLTYDSRRPGPEGSLDKLGWSEAFQELCDFALSLGGPERILTSGELPFGEGLFQHSYLYSRGRTIAAGTSEIQRSIIAERVLGLPRSGR